MIRPQNRHRLPWTLLFAALVIPTGRPAIEIKGFRMVESKGQVRSIEMRARTARLYKPEDILALDQLESSIYGEKRKAFQVKGTIGILDSNTQDFRIYQSSEVLSPDGYRFKSDSLLYQHAQQWLTTEDDVQAEPIHVKSDTQFRVSGRGLKIDIAESSYEIRRNARTDQKLPGGNTLQIRAQSAVFRPEEDIATFLRSVSVRSPTMEMKGDRLKIEFATEGDSDQKAMLHPKRLTLDGSKGLAGRLVQATLGRLKLHSKGLVINLDAEGAVQQSEAIGSVDGVTDEGVKLKAERLVSDVFEGKNRILLKDNVEILTDSRIAHCEDAQYFPDTGDIVLEKVASVKSEDQLLEGEVIRFSTRHSEIIVEKARGSTKKSNLLATPPKTGD